MTNSIFTKAKLALAIGGASLFLAACQTAAPVGGGNGGGGVVFNPGGFNPGQGAGGIVTQCRRNPASCPINPGANLGGNTGGNSGGGTGVPVYPHVPIQPQIPTNVADAIDRATFDPNDVRTW
jgi:hypothetical protein